MVEVVKTIINYINTTFGFTIFGLFISIKVFR